MTIKFRSFCGKIATTAAFLLPAFSVHASTAGPGTWSANQTWGADANHGGNLTGYYYWPSTQPTLAGKRALILVLHGCVQTAANDVINGSDGGYNWKTTADQYGAVIVAPNATGNVANNHCWDYYGANHTRTSGHVGVLLDVVDRFKNDPKFDIDPNQIYVTGLSSGGGQTMVMGCVAPDIFAGMGNNAGPALGTAIGEISGPPGGYTASTAAQNCRKVAGSNAGAFSTQIMNAIWGTSDYLVGQSYGPLNADAMRQVYGGTYTKQPDFTATGGGVGSQWKDANGKLRVSQIAVTGMSHAWPAGPGGQNTNYVDNTRVNYPDYITGFFFANNQRVSQDPAPTVSLCTAIVAADKHTVNVSGAATDNGSVASYQVKLNGATPISETVGSGVGFSKVYTSLADGNYSGTITATDNLGQVSSACTIANFQIGDAPAILPPTKLSVASTTATSASLTWAASAGASGYNVYRNGTKITAAPVAATSYTASGLTASTTYSFTVSAVSAAGESAQSSPVSATTGSAFTCTATFASNYMHVLLGRAHVSYGFALANGSDQNMGFYSLFFTSILAQTAPGYYIIGNCP